jgi:hypothetical protein
MLLLQVFAIMKYVGMPFQPRLEPTLKGEIFHSGRLRPYPEILHEQKALRKQSNH